MTSKFFISFISSVLFIFSGCSTIAFNHGKTDTGIFDADHPFIQYSGRFDHSHPKKVLFDLPGVYISAVFEGTSCSIRLKDTLNEYSVIVDNRAPRLLKADSAKSLFAVASGLDASVPHTIKIQKRTEAFLGRAEFGGFILDKECKLLPPGKRTERRIEFIGNSITCGYGVEGDSASCHFSAETENASISYAAMTARELNADYSLVAYSGRGVVRNYGDSNKVSVEPMPELYDRVCFADPLTKWDFTQWIPQAVVINLGTNDFSTRPFPDKEVFQRAYIQLINRVRGHYPGVTIFCICGPMIGEPCWSYIKEVVEQEQKGRRDKDVFFVGIDRNVLNDSDWGCDYHPNVFGMQKIANILVSAIKMRMSW